MVGFAKWPTNDDVPEITHRLSLVFCFQIKGTNVFQWANHELGYAFLISPFFLLSLSRLPCEVLDTIIYCLSLRVCGNAS